MITNKMRTSVLAALLFICCVGNSYAAETDWGWALSAYSIFQDSGSTSGFGVFQDSTDLWDTNDAMIFPDLKVYAATYHSSNSDGWLGPTGFYNYDFRAPMDDIPGMTQTWRVYCGPTRVCQPVQQPCV